MASVNFIYVLLLVIISVLAVSAAPLRSELEAPRKEWNTLREHIPEDALDYDDTGRDAINGDIFYLFADGVDLSKVIDDSKRGGF